MLRFWPEQNRYDLDRKAGAEAARVWPVGDLWLRGADEVPGEQPKSQNEMDITLGQATGSSSFTATTPGDSPLTTQQDKLWRLQKSETPEPEAPGLLLQKSETPEPLQKSGTLLLSTDSETGVSGPEPTAVAENVAPESLKAQRVVVPLAKAPPKPSTKAVPRPKTANLPSAKGTSLQMQRVKAAPKKA